MRISANKKYGKRSFVSQRACCAVAACYALPPVTKIRAANPPNIRTTGASGRWSRNRPARGKVSGSASARATRRMWKPKRSPLWGTTSSTSPNSQPPAPRKDTLPTSSAAAARIQKATTFSDLSDPPDTSLRRTHGRGTTIITGKSVPSAASNLTKTNTSIRTCASAVLKATTRWDSILNYCMTAPMKYRRGRPPIRY